MQELGFNVTETMPWFPLQVNASHVLVNIPASISTEWKDVLCDAIRRCYISDEHLEASAQRLDTLQHTGLQSCKSQVVASKLPDPGSVMSGDFGEILGYLFQATASHPHNPIGVKKWRLKMDRSKPAPYSDVVQFIMGDGSTPSPDDTLLCAEVKSKATLSTFNPIQNAIRDCKKDQTSRLAKTLVWLRERAIGEDLGAVTINRLDRFINLDTFPPYLKKFSAIAVICSTILENELQHIPSTPADDYSLIIISVPELHRTYNEVFRATKENIPQ